MPPDLANLGLRGPQLGGQIGGDYQGQIGKYPQTPDSGPQVGARGAPRGQSGGGWGCQSDPPIPPIPAPRPRGATPGIGGFLGVTLGGTWAPLAQVPPPLWGAPLAPPKVTQEPRNLTEFEENGQI